MGLDISAYSRISKLDCVFNADGEPIDPVTREPLDYDSFAQFYVNDSFPGRADEIEDRGVYSFADTDGLSAGAYSAYNRWRDALAKMAGWPKGEYEQYGRMWESHCVACWNGAEGAFSELINFSDCEGVIGAAVAKKLAADFAAHQHVANEHPDPVFRKKYAQFRAAFDLAADAGCVQFH